MNKSYNKQSDRPALRGRALAWTLGFGIINILLYLLLFLFSEQLVNLAMATKNGNKIYALVPLVLPMLFVFVHGTFTDNLWELIDFRAKQ